MSCTRNVGSVGKILVISHNMVLRGYGLDAFFFGSLLMPQISWVIGNCLFLRGKAVIQAGPFQIRITEISQFVIAVHSALAAHRKSLQNQKLTFINMIKPKLIIGMIRQELHLVLGTVINQTKVCPAA